MYLGPVKWPSKSVWLSGVCAVVLIAMADLVFGVEFSSSFFAVLVVGLLVVVAYWRSQNL